MIKVPTNGIETNALRIPAKGAPDVDGRHPTVVLVHGVGFDSLASFYFTVAAPLSAEGIEVITYDLRGHGRSSHPHTGYRLSDFVADLAGLLDSLEVSGPVHLVGNSFGGTVAFGYASAYPERVASLVMIEAEPATEAWSRKMAHFYGEFRQLEDPAKMDWLAETLGSHVAHLAQATSDKMRTTTLARDTISGPWLSREQVQSVRCPMMTVLGSESEFVDQVTLGSTLPHCRTVVLPGRGHLLFVEVPRTVLGLLASWVAEQHLVRRSQEEVSRA